MNKFFANLLTVIAIIATTSCTSVPKKPAHVIAKEAYKKGLEKGHYEAAGHPVAAVLDEEYTILRDDTGQSTYRTIGGRDSILSKDRHGKIIWVDLGPTVITGLER